MLSAPFLMPAETKIPVLLSTLVKRVSVFRMLYFLYVIYLDCLTLLYDNSNVLELGERES